MAAAAAAAVATLSVVKWSLSERERALSALPLVPRLVAHAHHPVLLAFSGRLPPKHTDGVQAVRIFVNMVVQPLHLRFEVIFVPTERRLI